MSDSNDWEEMEEKRALYRLAGVEEVRVVTRDGEVRLFADEERDASDIATNSPKSF